MNQAVPLARNSIVLSSGDYQGSCVVGLKYITVPVTWCADQVAVKLVPAQCMSDALVQLQLTRVSRYSNGLYLFDMPHVLRFIVEWNLCDRFSGFIQLELRVCLRAGSCSSIRIFQRLLLVERIPRCGYSAML